MENKKYIKVLFDQRVIPNYRAGVFRKLANMPNIDLTVSYWNNRFTDNTPHVYGELGFKTVDLKPISYRINGKYYWLNIDLVKYVFRKRPDVIIGPIGMFCVKPVLSKPVESVLRFLTGVRFVYRTSFGLLPGVQPNTSPKGLRKLFYKMLYRDVIVTTYTERAASIAIKQGCPSDRLFIDYNSMDSDELLTLREQLAKTENKWKDNFYNKYGIADNGFVLFVSRISREKRLDVLIDAWKLVVEKFKNVQLVVVGSGPGKAEAKQRAQDLGEHIIFVDGIYETEELAKFYYLASMVVFPGYATLSTHFAMCFGKPIISSQYGNEAEYVRDGVNGFVYDYGNVEGLAKKIEPLLENKKLAECFGFESERIVREKINVGHMVETIHSAINVAMGDVNGMDTKTGSARCM